MLVQKYLNYYEEKTPESLKNLIDYFDSYGFESYYEDMVDIFNQYNMLSFFGDKCEISTNGSTREPKTFEFGPNCSFCIRMIEGRLRMRHAKTILVWNPIFGSGAKIRFKITESLNNKMDFEVMGRWQMDGHILRLLEFMEECHEKWGRVNILSLPHIWICLTTNPIFRGWCEDNSQKINAFINSDSDLCIKAIRGVRVVDQMIDWETGVNFYTCEKGERHFLPVFFMEANKSFNLLNMTVKKSVVDDEVFLGAFRRCPCGRGSLEFGFSSHKQNRIVDSEGEPVRFEGFFDMLKGQYYSLQLYQNGLGEVSVLFCGQRVTEDLGKIEDFLKARGIDKIEFVSSKYIQIGRKRPPFWRSEKLSACGFSEKREIKLN